MREAIPPVPHMQNDKFKFIVFFLKLSVNKQFKLNTQNGCLNMNDKRRCLYVSGFVAVLTGQKIKRTA
jgi:hypothetical protein